MLSAWSIPPTDSTATASFPFPRLATRISLDPSQNQEPRMPPMASTCAILSKKQLQQEPAAAVVHGQAQAGRLVADQVGAAAAAAHSQPNPPRGHARATIKGEVQSMGVVWDGVLHDMVGYMLLLSVEFQKLVLGIPKQRQSRRVRKSQHVSTTMCCSAGRRRPSSRSLRLRTRPTRRAR